VDFPFWHYTMLQPCTTAELDGLLDTGNTCNDVFADSAYRSAEMEAKLRTAGYRSQIHRR
jgi:hypothetical protein